MTRLFTNYKIRINLLSIIFSLFSLIILIKTFYIQTFVAASYREQTAMAGMHKKNVEGLRGNIYDKNGNVLAETIQSYTFWVNTYKDVDKNKIIKLFSKTFNKSEEYYSQLLVDNKSYIALENKIIKSKCLNILNKIKSIKGLYFDTTTSRHYPYGNLASQVIGYVDMDGNGQFGLERQFNSILDGELGSKIYSRSANGTLRESIKFNNNKIDNGSDLETTIDINIQTILLDALNQGLKKSNAKSANGVILNPFTGDILAMASIPDFDPNKYWEYDVSNFLNKAISDAYEPGSTYKIVTMVAALELDLFTQADSFYCENGKYQIIPTKIIHDHEPHGNLSLSEIFIYSSNIGLSKIVEKIGDHNVYNFSRKFGFGIRTGVSLPSETSGVLHDYQNWSKLSGSSVSMGQEISINTLQLALAYSAIANGGYLPKARLINNITGDNYKNRDYSAKPIRKIMSNKTSENMLIMMENVVNKGTANKVRIPGFRYGGKTGTAEKFIDGSYSKREFISSFAAIFPIDNPKYVCIVSVDSPDYNKGKHWGNETAAPIVKDIFERIIINNKNFIPEQHQSINYAINQKMKSYNELYSNNIIYKEKIPDFRGLTLKQSIKKAKNIDLNIIPVGTSGRVVWQSIPPGKTMQRNINCTIKLETM